MSIKITVNAKNSTQEYEATSKLRKALKGAKPGGPASLLTDASALVGALAAALGITKVEVTTDVLEDTTVLVSLELDAEDARTETKAARKEASAAKRAATAAEKKLKAYEKAKAVKTKAPAKAPAKAPSVKTAKKTSRKK